VIVNSIEREAIENLNIDESVLEKITTRKMLVVPA